MEELARRVIESLHSGEASAELLARAGAADPASDARALGRVARVPALARQLEGWVPELLASARPGSGARRLESLAEVSPDLDLAAHPLLARLLGNSEFLGRWLLREPAWLEDLRGEMPPPPARAERDADWDALRRLKYRGLLRVAARDQAPRNFEAGLGELSDLADDILRRALTLSAGDEEPPALFALGKLGGRELNFSSDVDLIFVCDAPPDEGGQKLCDAAAGVVRRLKRGLEEPGGEGFGYRVDLELRPEGPPGALVRGVDATLAYYELRGAAWERQMLLRLRHLAGSAAAAREFVRGLEPFVYRRAIDPGVVEAVRAMKARIESERRASGRDLDRNLKEGPGGIRDVEFTVQALQLFHAGHRPELRTGHVLDAIEALTTGGVLPEASARALDAGYRWLRRAEHALQLVEEQQTAELPLGDAARTELARRMGYTPAEGSDALRAFESDLDAMRDSVRAEFEALVLAEPSA